MSDTPVISLRGITRVYSTGSVEVTALQDVDLDVPAGDFLAIVGPSGSGKSTLLHILGCLDRPTRGQYLLNGRPVDGLSDDELARLRNRELGFVFQSFNLLPRMTAQRNVEQPLIYARVPAAERRRRASQALERVGLGHRLHHRPNELSGGERQRVAVARALVNNPSVLLADEPTGNLDTRTGRDILALFHELNQAGVTIVLITHDLEVAGEARRIVEIRDGRIVGRREVEGRPGRGQAAQQPVDQEGRP